VSLQLLSSLVSVCIAYAAFALIISVKQMTSQYPNLPATSIAIFAYLTGASLFKLVIAVGVVNAGVSVLHPVIILKLVLRLLCCCRRKRAPPIDLYSDQNLDLTLEGQISIRIVLFIATLSFGCFFPLLWLLAPPLFVTLLLFDAACYDPKRPRMATPYRFENLLHAVKILVIITGIFSVGIDVFLGDFMLNLIGIAIAAIIVILLFCCCIVVIIYLCVTSRAKPPPLDPEELSLIQSTIQLPSYNLPADEFGMYCFCLKALL